MLKKMQCSCSTVSFPEKNAAQLQGLSHDFLRHSQANEAGLRKTAIRRKTTVNNRGISMGACSNQSLIDYIQA